VNWRKGLLRLWAVFSAAWIAVIVYAERPLAQLSKPVHFTAAGYEMEFPSDSTPVEIRQSLVKFFADKGITPTESAAETEVDQIVKAFPRSFVWERIRPILLEALIPPLGALGAALILAWIVAGFRSPPSKIA
jgi:hypothetical protein